MTDLIERQSAEIERLRQTENPLFDAIMEADLVKRTKPYAWAHKTIPQMVKFSRDDDTGYVIPLFTHPALEQVERQAAEIEQLRKDLLDYQMREQMAKIETGVVKEQLTKIEAAARELIRSWGRFDEEQKRQHLEDALK